MNTVRPSKGFTLLEMMMAIAILAVFTVFIFSTLIGTIRVVALEDTLLTMDRQANRAFQEIALELRPAILPVGLTEAERGGATVVLGGGIKTIPPSNTAFELLNHATLGFGLASPNASAWRTALQQGLDSIAFIVPVDAQNDDDYIDDAGHLEVGQIRPTGQSLGCAFINDAEGFRLSDTVPVNALVSVAPGSYRSATGLNAAGVENNATFDFAADNLIRTGGTWPAITAFTVIRYIPELQSNGQPVVVREADLGVDLDGDGNATDVFHIGRLRVVYTGGTHAVQPEGPAGTLPVVTANVPQMTRDITGPIVLRKTDGSTPIFRLGSPDTTGLFNPGAGVTSMQVRLLIYDREAQSGNPMVYNRVVPAIARWYESVITLRNMIR